MARCTTQHNGKYTHPGYSERVRPPVGLFLLIVLLAGTFLIRQNSKTVYEFPGEDLPGFTVPSVDMAIGDPDSAEDLVATGYEFAVKTSNGTFEASCPVICADFGKEINGCIIDELNNLLYCVQYAADNDEDLPATALSYQAYYEQDVLTLVLLETLQCGEQRNLVWIYDLKEGRRLDIHELPARYLDISFTEFLWSTDKYIVQQYTAQGEYQSEAEEQQHHRNCSFIQTDPANMTRYIFPTEKGLYLLYEMPISTEGYEYKTPTQTVIEPAEGLLTYIGLVPPREAVRELLFDTAVSVMGTDDQFHTDLVQLALKEQPGAFVSAATEDPEYAVKKLLLYTSHEDKLEITDICLILKEQKHWSSTEATVIDLILSSIENIS